jgi:hypothetical protein
MGFSWEGAMKSSWSTVLFAAVILIVAAGYSFQFRYEVISRLPPIGQALLWDTWLRRICASDFGTPKVYCERAKTTDPTPPQPPISYAPGSDLAKQVEQLRAAGFSQAEIDDWLSKRH